PEADGADDLPRGGHQRAAVERLVLLARGIHSLVGAAVAGGELSADDDHMADPVPLWHRRQLPASGDDRQAARAEGPAVVWRDHWILGRHHAGDLDREYSGLAAVTRDVRNERQAGNDRKVQGCARCWRQFPWPRDSR